MLDLDLALFDQTVRAVEEREKREAWGHTEELLATIAEIEHAQLQAFIQANSKSGGRGKPFRIPRPYEDQPTDTTPVVPHSEITSILGGGHG